MERRSVLTAGVAIAAAGVVRPAPAWAAGPEARLSAADVALGQRLFAAGAYEGLGRLLPLLLAGADRSEREGPSGAALAARVRVLASRLAVKQDRTQDAGVHAVRAGAAAHRSGDAVVLAAAARAAAPPLRRTGRAGTALSLLQEAHDQLTAGPRPTAAHLDAAGMVALTAAYTAAQAHLPAPARDFAAQAEQTAHRLAARHPHTAGPPRELSAAQCALYRIGIHRHLGDVDTALAYAAALEPAGLLTPERRARAATDTARALLDAGDMAAAFAQLRLVEGAAPHEASRPSVRALTARIGEHRPDLPGLAAYARRTAVVSPS
ncbi:transcriptional regulator [Streptomyces sp. NPDC001795]|uniref:transcriptional regulator n=1 Tax=Streptomyces sp. NPDC001795 TaxID=3154525 RepID=UPI00332AA29E